MKPMQKKTWKKVWALLLLCLPAQAAGLQVRADRVEGASTITDWGSGVYVGKFHVLTCAHVIEDGQKVFIKVSDGWAQCKVLKVDKANDLALLETRVQGDAVEFVNIPSMVVSGSPRGTPVRETSAGIDGAIVRAAIDVGDSGAPVTVEGRLIGIVKSKVVMADEVHAKIIGADKIAEFLK